MITEAMRQAFYEGKRSTELPLVINDEVTIVAGARSGSVAWIISPEATHPEPKFLVEYEDGSSEVRTLHDLKKK